MKYALMLGGLGLGIALGFLPSFRHRKPFWWRALTVTIVTVTVVLSLLPPIGGTYADAVIMGRAEPTRQIPVYLRTEPSTARTDSTGTVVLAGSDARRPDDRFTVWTSSDVAARLRDAGDGVPVIALARKGPSDAILMADDLLVVNPAITLPYIMGLEERARIIFFHVPMSWVAVIAYLLVLIFGIRYLRGGDLANDSAAAAMAGVGTLYCVLATVTGSVWAKFNWGEFWNWDPRETSILVLLLIYFAYFLLRSSIEDEERRARLSSVYGIIAFVTVPFLIFILPRLLPGLHPGSGDDSTAGPLLSMKSEAINPTKQVLFAVSLTAFTLVYFWLANLHYRVLERERRLAAARSEHV